MKCISLINQKGGVAKTTSTYNLAAAKALDLSDGKILMVDLDPQASLTIAVGIEPGEERLEGHSTCDLFDTQIDPLDAVFSVKSSGLENLYIIPSDITLAETEVKLVTKMYGAESVLKKAIKKLEPYFDYIFIDCPPQLGRLTINALVAASEVIIPCPADYLPYRGLQALLNTVNEITEVNPELKVDGIIVTMYESHIKDQKSIYDMLADKSNILGTVRKSTDVKRNTVTGVPVVLAMPNAKTAIEYKEIAKRI